MILPYRTCTAQGYPPEVWDRSTGRGIVNSSSVLSSSLHYFSCWALGTTERSFDISFTATPLSTTLQTPGLVEDDYYLHTYQGMNKYVLDFGAPGQQARSDSVNGEFQLVFDPHERVYSGAIYAVYNITVEYYDAAADTLTPIRDKQYETAVAYLSFLQK